MSATSEEEVAATVIQKREYSIRVRHDILRTRFTLYFVRIRAIGARVSSRSRRILLSSAKLKSQSIQFVS